MDIVEKITQTIEPSLDAMGYALVLVRLTDGDRRKILTVMAERKDGMSMGFNDCAEISRMAGALLEVEDPITEAYNLEVCSPGIDRPLTRLEDFSRYAGRTAKIETQLPMEGRRRFRGRLKKTEGNVITVTLPEGEVEIPFSNIRTAKLAVTDDVITEDFKKHRNKK